MQKMMKMKTQLQAVSLRLQTVKSQNAMATAIRGVARVRLSEDIASTITSSSLPRRNAHIQYLSSLDTNLSELSLTFSVYLPYRRWSK